MLGGKGRGGKTCRQTGNAIQARDVGLDPGGSSGGGKKIFSEHIVSSEEMENNQQPCIKRRLHGVEVT